MPYEGGEQQSEPDAVEERKDTECAANVEVAEEMLMADGINEDAGDKKTGDDEEEIHAGPAPPEDG